MNSNERIKELRKALSLNQEVFGERIGLTKSSVSNIEKGLRNVTEQHIRLLVNAFNINESWLRDGEGEMFIEPATFSLDEYAQKSQLTELELDIIKSYMDLNKDVREALLATAQQLFAKHAETAATVEESIEAEVEKELAIMRQELLEEKKAQMLSASPEQKKSG
ncbi:helix-turn-helix domain-containing protein [Metasolibacillus meyeri]|uniref:helix-turn-helix domain-containing protein n=1 Tax=Metasolibacillus meyeri TaxID=1071052 RepID=UPI000D2FDA58|nr:helix-turn-helix transcriptional regulator [Metasolibacillus meyeri]